MKCEFIDIVEVIAVATPGSHLVDCQTEAAILALTEKRQVSLIHNGVKYVADPFALIKSVESR